MNRSNEEYRKFAERHAKRSPVLRDCICAFLVGGLICCFGEALFSLYALLGMSELSARSLSSVTLVFVSVLLSGLDIFDEIAKLGGAGAFVPITGFANAVVAPAIDTKAEGWVLGVGAKLFSIAGAVIVYGTAASVIYGVIYWLFTAVL